MSIRFGFVLLLFSFILFSCAHIPDRQEPAPRSDSPGIVIGKILIKRGLPLTGGMVFFYDALTGPSPFKNEVHRVPTLRIDTDTDGKFKAELPPGKYYMKAVKMLAAKKAGLQDGDYVFFGQNDNGDAKEYIVTSGAILDIGVISGMVQFKKGQEIISTAIEGLITDMEGKPVEGVHVLAFTASEPTRKPLFFSQRTGPDGKFVLRVSEGTYYLRVRNELKGGSPAVGEFVGIAGDKTPAPVSVGDREIKKGINIIVRRFIGQGTGLLSRPSLTQQLITMPLSQQTVSGGH